MDSISSAKFNQIPVQQAAPQTKKEEAPKNPSDSVSLGNQAENFKEGGGNWFTALLDVRVPTTTKSFPKADVEKIMSSIKPGDVILETNNAYPGWQILEKTVFNSDLTHAAIYEGDGKFLEATTGDPSGKGVIRTDLREYLDGRIMVEIIRPPYKSEEDKKAALDYARSQLGKPYDSAFNQETDKEQYCAELVQRALASMPNPIEVPITNFFGHKAVGPNAFQKIPGAETVYSSGASFWKSMASHYPVYMGALAGAAAGAVTLGPLGAIGGFVTGGLLTTMAGNKIQAGSFSLFPE
ncbi:MAG: hypothetical protein LWY06_10150 [Firmicutes bacterium]|nr:hypothetical protein [Bacillota bacterium]